MSRLGRRRRQRKNLFGNFYLNPGVQYFTTIVSAIALAGFVFSGFLLFRFTDEEDLINRGRVQLMEGKVAWAAKTFQTLINHHPNSYEGHLLLGQAYLQLDERRKAQEQFEIAASLKSNRGDNAPEIALSKVAMAQGDFVKAERILEKAYRKEGGSKRKSSKEVRQAMFELYEQWGNTLFETEPKDFAQIVAKYEKALRFVNDYQSKQSVEEKLVDAIRLYTDRLIVMKDYPVAVHQLRISLRYKYLPETLVKIAESYGQMNQLDNSIEWYRKAFEANPTLVGLQLTNMLIARGQQLAKDKKPEEAQKYFEEADRVSRQAKIPLESLYPVSITSVKIVTDMDEATGEFEPKVDLKFANDSSRELNFLAVKVEFVSGTNTLAQAVEKVATPDKPLSMRGAQGKNTRTVSLAPADKINVHALQGGKMTVKVSIAYRDGADATWKVKSIQEAQIRSAPPPAATTPSPQPV